MSHPRVLAAFHGITFSLLLAAAVPSYALLQNTFDTGLEGWGSDYQRFHHTEPNGNGYLAVSNSGDSSYATAPWLGNWSQYESGALSFDAKRLYNPGAYTPDTFGIIRVFNSKLDYIDADVALGPDHPPPEWQRYSIRLDPGYWTIYGTSTWSEIISDVQLVRIYSSYGGHQTGFDNCRLEEPSSFVPEPTSCGLLALAVGGIGVTLRRRRQG